MQFKLTGTMIKNVWASDSHDSFLNHLQETIIDFKTKEPRTKIWSVWTRSELLLGHSYDIEGYITEKPNKGYINTAGKVAYKSDYNATRIVPLEDTQSAPDDFGPVPSFDSDEIPF